VKPPDTDPRALSYEVSSVHAEEERAARTGKVAAVEPYESCRRRQTRGKTVRGMRAYERNETNENHVPPHTTIFVSFVYFALSRAKGRVGLERR
jgi:hypothetical protein